MHLKLVQESCAYFGTRLSRKQRVSNDLRLTPKRKTTLRNSQAGGYFCCPSTGLSPLIVQAYRCFLPFLPFFPLPLPFGFPPTGPALEADEVLWFGSVQCHPCISHCFHCCFCCFLSSICVAAKFCARFARAPAGFGAGAFGKDRGRNLRAQEIQRRHHEIKVCYYWSEFSIFACEQTAT